MSSDTTATSRLRKARLGLEINSINISETRLEFTPYLLYLYITIRFIQTNLFQTNLLQTNLRQANLRSSAPPLS
jgi:uncharacterized protein YjbI with pentapeptide repeats